MNKFMNIDEDAYSEKIFHDGNLLAVILRADKLFEFGQSGNNVLFSTPRDFPFQLGVQNRSIGEKVEPHFHKSFEIIKMMPAQEFFYILSGKARVDLYVKKIKTKVAEVILEKGDMMIVNTGHSLEMLDNGQLLILKQGPYRGHDEEKIFIQD